MEPKNIRRPIDIAAKVAAARAMLEWTREDLASASGMASETIKKLETRNGGASVRTVEAIEAAFRRQGVFLTRDGVAMPPQVILEYQGEAGLKTVIDMIYEHCVANPSDPVFVMNIRQPDYIAWAKSFLHENRQRMAQIEGMASMRILMHEDDAGTDTPAYYSPRYLEASRFGSLGHYCFGSVVVFVDFDEDCHITVIKNEKMSRSFKLMFEEIWQHAKEKTR